MDFNSKLIHFRKVQGEKGVRVFSFVVTFADLKREIGLEATGNSVTFTRPGNIIE
jgi:hypothetical protein